MTIENSLSTTPIDSTLSQASITSIDTQASITSIDTQASVAPTNKITTDIQLKIAIEYFTQENLKNLKESSIISKEDQLIKNFLFTYLQLKNIGTMANSWWASTGLWFVQLWYSLRGLTNDTAQKKADFTSTIQELLPQLKPIEKYFENFFITLYENREDKELYDQTIEQTEKKLLLPNRINLNYFLTLFSSEKKASEPISNNDFKNLTSFIAGNFEPLAQIIINFQKDFKKSQNETSDLLKILLTGEDSTDNIQAIFDLVAANLADNQKKETLQFIFTKLGLSFVANHIEFIRDNIVPLKAIAINFQKDLVKNKDNSEIKNFLMGDSAERNFYLLLQLIIHNTENYNDNSNEKQQQLIVFLGDLKLQFIAKNLETFRKLAINLQNDLDPENFDGEPINWIEKILTGENIKNNIELLLNLITNNIKTPEVKKELQLFFTTYIKDQELCIILNDLVEGAQYNVATNEKEESIKLNLVKIIPHIDRIIASNGDTANTTKKKKTSETYLALIVGFNKSDKTLEINGNRTDLLDAAVTILDNKGILDSMSNAIQTLTPKIFQPTSTELQKNNKQYMIEIDKLNKANESLKTNDEKLSNFNKIKELQDQIKKNNKEIDNIKGDPQNLENNYILKIFKELLAINSDSIKNLLLQIINSIKIIDNNITLHTPEKERMQKIFSKENTENFVKIFEIITKIFKDSKFPIDSLFRDEIIQNIIEICNEIFAPDNIYIKNKLIEIISSKKSIGLWSGLNIFELTVLFTANPKTSDHLIEIYKSIKRYFTRDQAREELLAIIFNVMVLDSNNKDIAFQSYFTDYGILKNEKLKNSWYVICDILNSKENKEIKDTLLAKINEYNKLAIKLKHLEFFEQYICKPLEDLSRDSQELKNAFKDIKSILKCDKPINPKKVEKYRKEEKNIKYYLKRFNYHWNTNTQTIRSTTMGFCLILAFCAISAPILFIKKPHLDIKYKDNLMVLLLLVALTLVIVAVILNEINKNKTLEAGKKAGGEIPTDIVMTKITSEDHQLIIHSGVQF